MKLLLLLLSLALALCLFVVAHHGSVCQEAVHHASDAMQAEEQAFALTVGCSVGKVDDDWCTVKSINALIDAAEAARRAFTFTADQCE